MRLPHSRWPSVSPPRFSRGVGLVEALVATVLFATAVIAVLKIQATSIQANTAATYRSTAGFYTDQLLGQMWADSCANLSGYGTGGNTVALGTNTTLPNGRRSIAVTVTCAPTNATVTVTTFWQAPGDLTAHSDVTVATITGN